MRFVGSTSFSAVAAIAIAGGCAASGNDAAPTPANPDGGTTNVAPPDGDAAAGANAADAGGVTDIAFAPSTTFEKRDCTFVLRYTGTATEVKLAGEFTDWQNGAVTLTKTNGAFETTLSPGGALTAGDLYGYKLVVDGNWIIDPAAKYRKIVGDTLNSALRLPLCEAGPELTTGLFDVKPNGDAKLKVKVRSANDGTPPVRVSAKLDRGPVPAGSFEVDASTGTVSFSFKALAKGKHTLSLRSTDAKNREADPIDLPFWVEDEAFDYRDGILYMFVIDRFANGDKSNDAPVGNPVEYDADFHGGDLQGALKVLESGYFEKLGVRTIWLSPLNQQTSNPEQGDGNQWYSGYHGYWPTRARAVEPRFGGEAALRSFVDAAHARGIRVILDLINNQVYKDHEYIAPHPSFFRQSCKCGDDANACGWSQRPFDCMFQFYLPDINWRDYGAEQQFVADASFWMASASMR